MRKLINLIILYTCIIAVIYFGIDITAGVRNGIDISINLIIPSMFIFMIISNFILATEFKNIISLPFNFITKKLFKINDYDTAIFILSLIGGYPVGAKLLADSVKDNSLSPKKASIMLSYCVNCGPAFLISGIGGVILGNPQLGLFMYIAQIISCLVVGFISSFLINNTNNSINLSKTQNKNSKSQIFISSVIDAIKSLSIICGFVVFFSAVSPILLNIFGGLIDEVLLNGILEVTSGCNLATTKTPLQGILFASGFVAFGGICVILQIFAMLINTGITMKYFLLLKPIYILINIITTYILLQFFPNAITVFSNFCIVNCYSNSNTFEQNIFSVTPISTFFMIILAILLLFFSNKRDIIEEEIYN